MIDWTNLGGGKFEWRRVSGWFHPEFALSLDGRDLGTLQLGRGWKAPTTLSVGGDTWRFAQMWWSRRIAVTDESDGEIATFELRFFRGGTLVLAAGSRIEAAAPTWFHNALRFTDQGGSLLASLHPRGFGGTRCECELTPSGAESGLGGLLLGLGWYLIIQRRRHAAAAGAGA